MFYGNGTNGTHHFGNHSNNTNSSRSVSLYSKNGNYLTSVTYQYYLTILEQGQGLLLDGDIVVRLDQCSYSDVCWDMVSSLTYPWGKGEDNNPIHPYTNAFSNDFSIGDTIYVK